MTDHKKILCISHVKCSDGLLAAYVVGQRFGFEEVEFVECNYKDKLPDIKDRNVVIVDFSFKPEVLLPHLATVKTLILLDHHKSAMEDWKHPDVQADIADIQATRVESFISIVFDMEHSGAGLAWKFFFPGHEPSWIVKHTQDYDLWKFNYPKTKDIISGVYSTPEFEKGDVRLYDHLQTEEELDKMAERGRVVLEEKQKMIKGMIRSNAHRFVETGIGLSIPIMPLSYTHASEAGVLLNAEAIKRIESDIFSHEYIYDIEKAGGVFAATYTENWEKGFRVFSLRSDKNYFLAADVSAIARRYGGGGHKNSAGFTVPIQVPLKYIFDNRLFSRLVVKLAIWLYRKD